MSNTQFGILMTSILGGIALIAGVIIYSTREPTHEERAKDALDTVNAVIEEAAQRTESAAHQITMNNIKQLELSIKMYAAENRDAMPNSLNTMVPEYVPDPGIFRDYWGSQIMYTYSAMTTTLRSFGPDRKMGTSDDLVSRMTITN